MSFAKLKRNQNLSTKAYKSWWFYELDEQYYTLTHNISLFHCSYTDPLSIDLY